MLTLSYVFWLISSKKQYGSVIMVVLSGVVHCLIVMGIAFGVSNFSGVMEASLLVTSATSGPLLGVFLLAILFPSVNWKVSPRPFPPTAKRQKMG